MSKYKVQHLIDQALEHQVTSGFTDDVYRKGSAFVSRAFTDKLIELILKECTDITEYFDDVTADFMLKEHFGIEHGYSRIGI